MSPHRPDPWRRVWHTATGPILLAVSLGILAGYLLMMAWIPQIPLGSGPADRWLVQTRFGPWTGTMYRLGLFTLARSPVLIILLSLLAFLLTLRSVDLAEAVLRPDHRAGPPRWKNGFLLLACGGILILLTGMLVGFRWGWREEPLSASEATSAPGHQDGQARLYRVGWGDVLTVRATDATGHPLGLQQTAREAARTELVLYLSPQAPEASFAVPDIGLVVRLGNRGDPAAPGLIQVEVFRAPGGEPVQEAAMERGPLSLAVNGVNLEIVRQPYPLLARVYDPGLWLKRAGLLLGAIGLASALSPGWRKENIPDLLLSILTVLVAGLAGYSLERRGALGALPGQLELTALWLVGLAIWMARSPNRPQVY